MDESFQKSLETKLLLRDAQGLRRELKSLQHLVDFASNDYLGLARSGELTALIEEEVTCYKLGNGSTGSRLLTGNSTYIDEVEQYLARIFIGDAALVLNSGYSANLSVLSSIPGKNDTIIYDELAHACIKDGARLSLAKRFSFKHNDTDDLLRKIKSASGRIYIAVESIYSMDGDEAPLERIVSIAREYDAVVILDEAHSTGVIGENGNGMAVSLNIAEAVDIRIYTFGKAMGIHGACVVGSNSLRDYLINFARPFIYTTAPDPHSIAAIKSAFRILGKHGHLQSLLRKNINLFRDLTNTITNKTISNSAIQTLIVPGNENARAAATHIQAQGIDVRPILSPTVPAGKERLRICIHAYNTEEEIKRLAMLLNQISANRSKSH